MCLGILPGWDLRQERLSFNNLLPAIQRRFRVALTIILAIFLLLCGAADTAKAQSSQLPPALQAAINTGNQQAIEQTITTLSGGSAVQAASLASQVAQAGEQLLSTNPMGAVAAEAAAVDTVRSTAVQVAAPQQTQDVLTTAAWVFVSPQAQRVAPEQTAVLASLTVQAASTTGNPTLIAAISAQAIVVAETVVVVTPVAAVQLASSAVQAVNNTQVLAAAPADCLNVAVSAARIIVNPDVQAAVPQTVANIAYSTLSIVSPPSVYQTSPSAAIGAMANAYAAVNSSTVVAAVPAAASVAKGLLEQAAILNPSGAVDIQNIINAYEPANPTVALAASSATPAPSQLGQTVSIATTISPSSEAGNLKGRFTIYDGARVLGTGSRNGTAVSLDTATLSAGTHKLWVHYQEPAGGTYNSANSGVASLSVNTIAAEAVTAGPSLPVVGNRAVLSGDFNSDGNQDLAAIDDQGRLSIFLGKGDGSFEPAPGSPMTLSISALSAIVIADFNQDGNPDLAVADSNRIYLLLGNNDGSFSNGAILTRSGQICGVVAADFNGDGRVDLAVADSSSNDVTIYLGKGDATFTATSTIAIPSGASPTGLAVGLLNSDTIPDLVVASSNDSVLVFLGNEDGTLAAPSTLSIAAGTASKVEISDLNGDGFADLAVISPSTGMVSLFMGNGGGTFTSGAVLTTPSGADIVRSGDFNGDGKLDFFIASSLSGNVSVFLGNGDGTFQAQHSLANLDSVKDLALGEFNGDARTDLVIADYNNSSLDILLGSTAIPVTLLPSSLSDGIYGLAYSVTMSATGGVAPYTYTTSGGVLPSGLTLDSSGILSGTPTSAGTYSFTVAATDVNGTKGSQDFTLVVGRATPPALSVTNSPVTYNGSAQAATVTGSVAGTVSNVKYNGSSTVPTNAGTYAVIADFTPTDTNDYNSLSGTSAGSFRIDQAAATIMLGNLTQTYDGMPKAVIVTSHASVVVTYTGIAPTAYATSVTPPAEPGSYSVVATVTDPNYVGGATGTLAINPIAGNFALSLLTGMPEPSPYGTRVYFELSQPTTPCPTGQVQFFVDGQPDAKVSLSTLRCSAPIEYQNAVLSVGPHSIYAIYSGDAHYTPATSNTMSHQVVADGTVITLATSAGTINVGQSVSLTATLSLQNAVDGSAQNPVGHVEFLDAGSPIGSSALSATAPYTAVFTTWSLAAGSHSITARYVDSNGLYSGSTSAVSIETVNKIVPTISWTPVATIIVYGTALGSEQLNATASDSSTPVEGSFSYDPAMGKVLGVGQRTINVTFTPTDDATYSTQTASVTITVQPATLTVAPGNQSRAYGAGDPTFSYQITGFVNGEAQDIASGTPVVTSSAMATSAVGSYPITATVGTLAAENYTFSFAPGTLAITPAVLLIAANDDTKTYGQTRSYGVGSAAFTASGLANGEGIGWVTITASGGTAASAPVGDYMLTPSAAVGGTFTASNYKITYNPGTLTVGKAAAAVTPMAASKTYGASDPALTGTLSGFVATDNVTVSYSRAAGETVAGGPYAITATLSPAAVLGNYDVNYGTAAFTITKAATSAALHTSAATVMLKSDAILTAKITSTSGAPTGSVTFMDGTTVLGSGAVDNGGTATLTVSTLAEGAHNLTAVYSGDSNFSGSTSTATSLTVQDFQLAVAGGSVTSITVLPGAVATYQLTLTPTGGTSFPATVTLALTGLPAGATYTITPAAIAAGSGTQTVTVRVQTAKVAASLHRGSTGAASLGLALLSILGIVHLGCAGAGRKKRAVLMLGLLLAFGILDMTACGGGSGFMNQASQTYNLQLNATSGALQHSAALTLRVQ